MNLGLIWCKRNGYNVNESVLTYRPTLKEIKKTVTFLTWEEVMRVYHTEMPSKILTEVKDVFLLSLFTSLRHSGLLNLQPEDIKEDHIEIVTVKTSDPLRIELNDYSRSILDKYDNKIPKMANQTMNRYLKQVGAICELNASVTLTTIKAGKRVSTTYKTWQVMSTHMGRRTFISNAIGHFGIPPDVVMKWTGHKDYEAMRPYIEIADKSKEDSEGRVLLRDTSLEEIEQQLTSVD